MYKFVKDSEGDGEVILLCMHVHVQVFFPEVPYSWKWYRCQNVNHSFHQEGGPRKCNEHS